jgi:hypothetical protein
VLEVGGQRFQDSTNRTTVFDAVFQLHDAGKSVNSNDSPVAAKGGINGQFDVETRGIFFVAGPDNGAFPRQMAFTGDTFLLRRIFEILGFFVEFPRKVIFSGPAVMPFAKFSPHGSLGFLLLGHHLIVTESVGPPKGHSDVV